MDYDVLIVGGGPAGKVRNAHLPFRLIISHQTQIASSRERRRLISVFD